MEEDWYSKYLRANSNRSRLQPENLLALQNSPAPVIKRRFKVSEMLVDDRTRTRPSEIAPMSPEELKNMPVPKIERRYKESQNITDTRNEPRNHVPLGLIARNRGRNLRRKTGQKQRQNGTDRRYQ